MADSLQTLLSNSTPANFAFISNFRPYLVEALRVKEAELAAVQSDRESDQQSEAAARSELEVGRC